MLHHLRSDKGSSLDSRQPACCPKAWWRSLALAGPPSTDFEGLMTSFRLRPREVAEALERKNLAPGATLSDASAGTCCTRRARSVAHIIRARPRPDSARKSVSKAEAQDTGVHESGGRPLRYAHDPHAPGDPDRRGDSTVRSRSTMILPRLSVLGTT